MPIKKYTCYLLPLFTVLATGSISRQEKLDLTADFAMPGKRWAHQMSYDDAAGHVLLFGGSYGSKILGDLWSWDGTSWEQMAASGPPAINKGIFVYDVARKSSVLFGGANQTDSNVGDTWEWHGGVWKEVNVQCPPARVHGTGVYDDTNKMILIYGGFGSSGSLRDTWAFDGSGWKELNTNGPKDCLPLGMVYDRTRQVIIMITMMLSADPATGKPNNELWEWTGNSWRRLPVSVPPISGLQPLTSDSDGNIILYDGNDGATWIYSAGKWDKASTTGPGLRMGAAIVYDKKRNKIVLFGGGKADTDIRYNDTWEWDGKQWKEKK
jgi:hypothetical protein